ncbi:hypothetical protein OX459_09375 [Janthinobacterium sp. SUN026]|nr:hypothetical protein [Janthinobacterium sp. SUN026]MDN2671596.1 hypothetical protein [Janthinobacterium sp. SUN026]
MCIDVQRSDRDRAGACGAGIAGAAMREVAVFAFDGAQFAVYGDAIVAQ